MEAAKNSSFFSKPINWIALLAAIILLIILILKWCDNKNGIKLNDPIKAPVAIAFIDANRYLNTQIPDVKVTLIDPDSMVVTSNGFSFSSILVPGGVMSLGLKLKASLSAEKPYRFTIKAESEGYSPNYRSILITEDKGYYIPIFMAKVDDPPEGMAGFAGAIPVEDSQNPTTLTLTPNFVNNVSSAVNVEIPEGTLFMRDQCLIAADADSISYRFTFASPRNIAAGRTFPGGSLVTDAVDANGEIIATPSAPFYFASAGWMTLEMKAGGENINRFSKPIRLQIPISDSLINPKTQMLYKAGDKVDTWSLNERGVWQQDSSAIVQNGPNGLYVNMRVIHLSTWNIDAPMPQQCASDITINYNNPNVTIDRYSELISAQTGIAYGIAGPFATDDEVLTYNNGSGGANHHFTMARAPMGTDVEFRVYDGVTTPANLFASTGIFQTCNNPGTLTLPPLAGTPQTVNLSFAYRTGMTDHPICNNTVWFAECSTCATPGSCATPTNPYQFGAILTVSGNAGTATLQRHAVAFDAPGHSNHCIRLWYAGIDSITGLPISQQIDFNMDFADTSSRTITVGSISIDYSFSGGIHRFVFTGGLPVLSPC